MWLEKPEYWSSKINIHYLIEIIHFIVVTQCFLILFGLRHPDKFVITLTWQKMTSCGTISGKMIKSKLNIWRHPRHLFTATLCAEAPRSGITACHYVYGIMKSVAHVNSALNDVVSPFLISLQSSPEVNWLQMLEKIYKLWKYLFMIEQLTK